jgi:inosine/xanthosine triphosphatase
MKIIIASKNPVKIEAARKSFCTAYADDEIEIIAVDAPSLVSDQPMSTQETRDGAVNRVTYCQQSYEADYYVSYEGGVDVLDNVPSTFAVVCIANSKKLQTGRTASLPLPNQIYQKLKMGEELGPAMDNMFNTVNIKQKGGAIGQLTNGLETRESIYVSATLLTLSAFFYPELFI